MTTLGVFTVKKLVHDGTDYWTDGGFGRYLLPIAAAFDRVLLFAHVKDGRPTSQMYRLLCEGLDVVRLPWPRNELHAAWSSSQTWIQANRRVAECDIVHARVPDLTGVVGAYVARRKGIPVFVSTVADWAQYSREVAPDRHVILRNMLRLYLLGYDALERLVCRNQLVFAQGLSSYSKHKANADAILVVSSAHRRDEVLASPREKFSQRPYTILCIGRLTGVKNHVMAINLLEALLQESPDWQLRILGDGPHLDRLTAMAARLGLSNRVNFTAGVPYGPKLWGVLDESDVLFHPSLSEGTPKVVLEAMARSVPVLAARVGGVETQVNHGENGLIFEPRDLEDALRSLRLIASDPGLRRRLTASGLQTARDTCVEVQTHLMLSECGRRWPEIQLAVHDE